jgi:hypothetical protein
MIHSWVVMDGYVECTACGMIVDVSPYEDGYYPCECDPPERHDTHRHHIVASVRGAECYYCPEVFN